MTFVQVQKDKAYYKRYQVKYRRRREGKTDYQARRRMTIQAKNKYASPKYRLVVRFTCSKVICQIVYATIAGDVCMAAAESTELKRYGLKAGYKNYPAAYCTGLLVARRVLKKIGLHEKYTGTGDDLPEDEVTGEIMTVEFGKKTFYVDELDEDRRPFRVNLDTGLKRTSLGSKVFGAMKGASDGGLDIPHNHKKLHGYDKDEDTFDASVLRDQIFGEPLKEYMEYLQQEDEESGTKSYEEKFATYVAAGVGPDDLEEMYLAVHKAIRENPDPLHKESNKARKAKVTHNKEFKRPARKTLEAKKADIQAKLEKIEAAEAESSDDEE